MTKHMKTHYLILLITLPAHLVLNLYLSTIG